MAEGSIITDEIKALLNVPSEPTVYKVEEGAIIRYAEAVDDANPLYSDIEYASHSRYGRQICPPGFTGWPLKSRRVTEGVFESLWRAGAPQRLLAGGVEYEFFIPVGAGDVLVSTHKITGITEKESKSGKMLMAVLETTFLNQNGDVVVKSWQTFIFR
jgi:acyl dehydratase